MLATDQYSALCRNHWLHNSDVCIEPISTLAIDRDCSAVDVSEGSPSVLGILVRIMWGSLFYQIPELSVLLGIGSIADIDVVSQVDTRMVSQVHW